MFEIQDPNFRFYDAEVPIGQGRTQDGVPTISLIAWSNFLDLISLSPNHSEGENMKTV